MLLEEFWATRFEPYCHGALRESTMVGYESAWRRHIRPEFGGRELPEITVEAVDSWLAEFERPGAARKAWSVLRAMLRRAIRWSLLDVDITRRDIRLPQKHRYEPRLLTVRQTRELLRGFWGHELEAWLICSATLGLAGLSAA